MSGQDYSWVASALYFGWLVGSYPSNLALQRLPIAKFIGCILFVWGAICMLQATVFNFSGFFAVRFFLGLVEACVSPAWMLLTSMLWTRDEQPLRTSFWISMNGLASILGALLSWGLGHADGTSIANWKLIYLVRAFYSFSSSHLTYLARTGGRRRDYTMGCCDPPLPSRWSPQGPDSERL